MNYIQQCHWGVKHMLPGSSKESLWSSQPREHFIKSILFLLTKLLITKAWWADQVTPSASFNREIVLPFANWKTHVLNIFSDVCVSFKTKVHSTCQKSNHWLENIYQLASEGFLCLKGPSWHSLGHIHNPLSTWNICSFSILLNSAYPDPQLTELNPLWYKFQAASNAYTKSIKHESEKDCRDTYLKSTQRNGNSSEAPNKLVQQDEECHRHVTKHRPNINSFCSLLVKKSSSTICTSERSPTAPCPPPQHHVPSGG